MARASKGISPILKLTLVLACLHLSTCVRVNVPVTTTVFAHDNKNSIPHTDYLKQEEGLQAVPDFPFLEGGEDVLKVVAANARASFPSMFNFDVTKKQPWAAPAQPKVCPWNPPPKPFPNGTIPDVVQTALTAIETNLASLVNGATTQSLSASIVYRDSVIWSFSAGTISKTNTSKPDLDTIYRIGSVSKLFPTVLAYKAFVDGKVTSLDDPLSKYNSNFQLQNQNVYDWTGPTIRQLLSQLSGISREPPCVPFIVKGNSCNATTADILALLAKTSVIMPQYQIPSYSNLAYALVGNLLAEGLYNTSFSDYAETNIWGPAKMTSTGADYTANVTSRMAVGYVNGVQASLYSLGWTSPAGQYYSTSRDLSTLGIDLLAAYNNTRPDTLMPNAIVREMMLPMFVDTDAKTFFGTPWEGQLIQNYTVLAKGGNVPGYSAMFSVVPKAALSANVLFTGGGSSPAVAKAIYELLLPAFYTFNTPASGYNIPMGPNWADVIGVYANQAKTITMSISLIPGALLCKITGPFPLSVFLEWEDRLGQYQLYAPPNVARSGCDTLEMVAFNHQTVLFTTDPSTNVTTATVPGFLLGYSLQKQ